MPQNRPAQPTRDPWLRQAFDEIGQTDISRSGAMWLVIVFGLLVLGVSFTELRAPSTRAAIGDLGRSTAIAIRSVVREPLRLRAASGDVLAAIDRAETRLEDGAWLARIAGPFLDPPLARLGTTANRQVILGSARDDPRWLSYRPGVDYVVGKPFLDPAVLRRRALGGKAWQPRRHPDPRPAMFDFADSLDRLGIALLVVPTPTKVMLAPEALGARSDPAVRAADRHNPSFAAWVGDLEMAGIDVLDPTPTLETARQAGIRTFLRGDSHWTPQAVDLVAAKIAARIEARGMLAPREATFDTDIERGSETRTGIGDLVRMRAAPGTPERELDRHREPIVVDRVAQVGATESSILLLGDSFSAIYADDRLGWGTDAGLADQLAFHLDRPVASLTVQGGGADAARRRFAEAMRAGSFPRLQVVVWQIAVRELSSGSWPLIAIDAPTAADPGAHQPVRVRATVAARASAPRPGETPYPDALIALHLIHVEPVDADAETSIADSVLVYTWGLRDNQSVSSDRIVVGDRIEVELMPWSAVVERYGGLERREIAQPSLFALDAYWMEAP